MKRADLVQRWLLMIASNFGSTRAALWIVIYLISEKVI